MFPRGGLDSSELYSIVSGREPEQLFSTLFYNNNVSVILNSRQPQYSDAVSFVQLDDTCINNSICDSMATVDSYTLTESDTSSCGSTSSSDDAIDFNDSLYINAQFICCNYCGGDACDCDQSEDDWSDVGVPCVSRDGAHSGSSDAMNEVSWRCPYGSQGTQDEQVDGDSPLVRVGEQRDSYSPLTNVLNSHGPLSVCPVKETWVPVPELWEHVIDGALPIIKPHVTRSDCVVRGTLPARPDCPGPEALSAEEALPRPDSSKIFAEYQPALVKIYDLVKKSAVPNYRGVKCPVPSALNITKWRECASVISDRSLVD